MDETLQEIELGARVCLKIKNELFSDRNWDGKLNQEISVYFTNLKKVAIGYYSNKTKFQILDNLEKLTKQDFEDAGAK